ncbi:hypothetical protein PtrSN002B_005971 [Pyrenophora tritici-repentis]|nr:hypothetical protein PtrSN001A_005778 [Pyrenophora tritici-repentis]KAI1550302.1 hypothetical protein PtrSN002B_005971 [Pyrenophora tritici-repentis]KAI1590068.1 hypothetical protein PtrEW13061_005769 [Pyrenophora tritici-repentis]PZD27297.1 hypothetical protein A1F96_06870 [Pyrenophora tritici-repentis]
MNDLDKKRTTAVSAQHTPRSTPDELITRFMYTDHSITRPEFDEEARQDRYNDSDRPEAINLSSLAQFAEFQPLLNEPT